jgi:hypothetical protein
MNDTVKIYGVNCYQAPLNETPENVLAYNLLGKKTGL